MSVIERIAMCMNPRGLHEHVPLKPDEPMPTTCFADCDCTPVEFVRVEQLQGAVAVVRELRDVIVRPVDMESEEFAKRLIAAVARADALLGGQSGRMDP